MSGGAVGLQAEKALKVHEDGEQRRRGRVELEDRREVGARGRALRREELEELSGQ